MKIIYHFPYIGKAKKVWWDDRNGIDVDFPTYIKYRKKQGLIQFDGHFAVCLLGFGIGVSW